MKVIRRIILIISIVLLIIMFTDFISLGSDLPILIGGILITALGIISVKEGEKGEGYMLLGCGLILAIMSSVGLLLI